MTIPKWWVIGAGIALMLFVTLGSWAWLQEHDARLKTEAQTAGQQKTIDQAKANEATTQQTLDARLKALEALRQQPATPQQIVLDLSKAVPGLPQPAQVVTPPPTQQVVNGKTEEIPSAPVVQIPAADFKALQDYGITCQETGAKLDACTLTLTDTKTELAATTAQRDEWKTTAKGGSFWTRLKSNAIKIGITAGVAGGAGYLAGTRKK